MNRIFLSKGGNIRFGYKVIADRHRMNMNINRQNVHYKYLIINI